MECPINPVVNPLDSLPLHDLDPTRYFCFSIKPELWMGLVSERGKMIPDFT